MKKISIVIFILIMYSEIVLSNPIALPQASISEFMFTGDNSWVLEIKFNNLDLNKTKNFDSILIASSNGISHINLSSLNQNSVFYVLDSDSLQTPIAINRNGDCIKLYSYLSGFSSAMLEIDSLAFGNYPGSVIDSIPAGYSICKNGGLMCKCKHPTIGFSNDTSGCLGTLEGYIFDKNNKLVTNGNFSLDYYFIPDGKGKYTTRVFARKVTWSGIFYWYYITENSGLGRGVLIDTLKINMNPDSVVIADIHLKTDYLEGIKEKNNEQSPELSITNYPNPFNSSTNFQIKIPSALQDKSGEIVIFNINGRRVKTISISNNSTVHWDGSDSNGKIVSSGIYYYRLVIDKNIYKTGSMIFLK